MDCKKYRNYLQNTENHIIPDCSEYNSKYEICKEKYFDDEYDTIQVLINEFRKLHKVIKFCQEIEIGVAIRSKNMYELTNIIFERNKNKEYQVITHLYFLIYSELSYDDYYNLQGIIFDVINYTIKNHFKDYKKKSRFLKKYIANLAISFKGFDNTLYFGHDFTQAYILGLAPDPFAYITIQ